MIIAAIAALALLVPHTVLADDYGLVIDAGVEKKFNKKFTLTGLAEFQSRNTFRTVDRVSVRVGGKYRLNSWLRAEAAYQFIVVNNREHLSYNKDGSYNNWRPSFWGTRHRATAALVASVDLGRFNVSLRERYQYTYRPEATTTRYDFDNEWFEDCTVKSKHDHVLRSRVKVQYNIRHCKFTPHVSAEIYTSDVYDKTKLAVGGSYTLKKHHGFVLEYQHELLNRTQHPSSIAKQHIVAGYTYKF